MYPIGILLDEKVNPMPVDVFPEIQSDALIQNI
jgi:hypothetical protein